MRHFHTALMVFSLACASLHGQTSGSSTGAMASGLPAGNAPSLKLAAGDLIDVEVFDTPELSASRLRVNEAGSVKLPVAGPITVAGLTAYDASNLIESRLRDASIMIDPHVTIFVSEYATQGVRVLGQVRNPGTFVLLGHHSLYDALAAAGGVSIQEGSTITITRQDDPDHPRVIAVNSANYSTEQQSTYVGPGDLIVVSRADGVFVLGDVARPGEFFIDNGKPMTVLAALALAAGTNRAAVGSKAFILRKTSDGTIIVPVNIKQVEHNVQPNVVLQASDYLIVPHSEVKQFFQTLLPFATGDVIGAAAGYAFYR